MGVTTPTTFTMYKIPIKRINKSAERSVHIYLLYGLVCALYAQLECMLNLSIQHFDIFVILPTVWVTAAILGDGSIVEENVVEF